MLLNLLITFKFSLEMIAKNVWWDDWNWGVLVSIDKKTQPDRDSIKACPKAEKVPKG